MEEYKKTCEDELDWVGVNQLHEATLQISKSCFEFKKICVGLIGVALAVLVKITDSQINHSYFLIPLLICFGFWVADFSAYYFQRRTRMAMNQKLAAIAERNSIEDYHVESLAASWVRAAFNHSMSLYYAFAVLGSMGWLLYLAGWIGN